MKKKFILSLFILMVSCVSWVSAAVIVNVDFPLGVDLFYYNLNEANNDDQNLSVEDVLDDPLGVSANWLGVQKVFSSMDPYDFTIDVSSSGGTTEYLLIEKVYNFSESFWTDYKVELGVGSGADFISLSDLSSDSIGLDFDHPEYDPYPSSFYSSISFDPIFIDADAKKDTLHFKNGYVPVSSDMAVFGFSIDIPDLGQDYQFTVRQTPMMIPEPGTGLLVLIGFFIAMIRKQS